MNQLILGSLYRNALTDLNSGFLMPQDKQVLSFMPLPESAIEPFTAREIPDVRASMAMTCDAMSVWIEEAKKTSYFSKRFVQLSKMVMNGVAMMGRGLITLHDRGESFDDVPMSVQDLIGVASYHLRKSYLGVLQTVKTHPEISERLLINQISWNNTLMRLFRTRDKLAEPVLSASRTQTGELPSGGIDSAAPASGSSARRIAAPAFSAASAMPGLNSFSAPHAFSTYDHTHKPASPVSASHAAVSKSSAAETEIQNGTSAPAATAEISKAKPENKTAETKNSKVGTETETAETENQKPEPGYIKTETENKTAKPENIKTDPETKTAETENQKAKAENIKTGPENNTAKPNDLTAEAENRKADPDPKSTKPKAPAAGTDNCKSEPDPKSAEPKDPTSGADNNNADPDTFIISLSGPEQLADLFLHPPAPPPRS